MALPGDCFTSAASAPRQKPLDRSSKKPVLRSASTNRLPSHRHSKFDPVYKTNAPKTLVERARLLQKKKESEAMASKQQPHLANMMAPKKPKHLDLMDAVSSKERECLKGLQDYGLLDSRRKKSRESTGIKIKHIPDSDSSYREIAYSEYISQAWNLSNNNLGHPADQRSQVPRSFGHSKNNSDSSATSTEASGACSTKDRRPKIQVTIPKSRRRSFVQPPYRSPSIKVREALKTRESFSAVSPPSTTARDMSNDIQQAHLSIVSPLSVVEMPKPRRPFSANSFETMSLELPRTAPLVKSNSVDSSDDTSGQDDRSSNYSPTSSMSSLTSDTDLQKAVEHRRASLALSVFSPTAAGVFDQPYPKIPRSMKSTLSLADKSNMNKPLPPAPGLGEITPLSVSRSGSMKRRHGHIPAPLSMTRSSTTNLPSRRISRVSSLRSKYTPDDLDALDNAFLKQSPQMMEEPSFAYPDSPTLSQAEMALEAHLGTIEEDSVIESHELHVPLLHDPLQITRGPMHMKPSRRPPPPPSTRSSQSFHISEASTPKSRRLQKRSPSHVVLQMRGTSDASLRRRISAPVVGSSVKASKILGQTTAIPMERDGSSDSNFSPTESCHAYSDSSDLAREDSSTPESDFSSSVPDAAFEEIRRRLEVLSPKVDATEQFLAFRNRVSSDAYSIYSVKLPLQAHSTAQTPLTSRPTTSHGEDGDIPAVPRVPETYKSETANESAIASDILTPPSIKEYACADNDVQKHERRGGPDNLSVRTRSLGSIAMSEIPDMYAALPSPTSTINAPMTQEEVERMISADAAEQVLLRILENLDNLQDLFATATVSRGFYRTFKRHELPLMKNALFGMSPAAWELREMSPPYPGLEGTSPKLGYTPSVYLQHYMRDMYTMIALKSMILVHCESFLRADTITALAGGETERASQIDDAFWRVWTFCRIFGCGTDREADIVAQMDWLRAGVHAKQQRLGGTGSESPSFGQGNQGGLNAEDLYDMTEIWTCLGVLVRGFQGKRQLARNVGIFEHADITSGDIEREDAALEEWTYHLLTLAPPTVLDVTTPGSPTETTFAHAQACGYTTWAPPTLSRSTFLKEAVSRVYEERMAARHPTVSSDLSNSPNASPASPQAPSNALLSRQRCAMHAVTIRAKRLDPSFAALPISEERPMSNWTDIVTRLDSDAPPMPNGLPTPAATPKPPKVHLMIPKTSSHYRIPTAPSPNLQTPAISLPSSIPTGPQIRDPVDVAVDRLVAMGFDERKAKKALADTDSGNSVDFDKAVEVLVRDRKRDVGNLMHGSYRGRKAEGEGASERAGKIAEGPGLMGASGESPVMWA